MANLLSELLGLGTQIPICFDQHCPYNQHYINLESKTWGDYAHTHNHTHTERETGTPVKLINKEHKTKNASKSMKATLNTNLTERQGKTPIQQGLRKEQILHTV